MTVQGLLKYPLGFKTFTDVMPNSIGMSTKAA